MSPVELRGLPGHGLRPAWFECGLRGKGAEVQGDARKSPGKDLTHQVPQVRNEEWGDGSGGETWYVFLFFFLGTNDKRRRVSWGSCLGDFWQVFFQHGASVNDERINLENINCKRHCKSMRIIECFPWLCCSVRRRGICFFLSSFWLNCSVLIRHGIVKGRMCCWLGWWLQTPDLFWDTCLQWWFRITIFTTCCWSEFAQVFGKSKASYNILYLFINISVWILWYQLISYMAYNMCQYYIKLYHGYWSEQKYLARTLAQARQTLQCIIKILYKRLFDKIVSSINEVTLIRQRPGISGFPVLLCLICIWFLARFWDGFRNG